MPEIGSFLLRTETELIIKNRRGIPVLLVSHGFRFDYSVFENAVIALEREAAANNL